MNEKEAIEQLKIIKRNIDKKYINTKNSKAIETVLNLIKKQQAEIESLEQEKQEAWEEWNNIDNYCEQEKQKYKAEIEKKDKIINLMAKDIKEADKFLDSMGYLGEYEGYTIEGIVEEYNQKIEKGEQGVWEKIL